MHISLAATSDVTQVNIGSTAVRLVAPASYANHSDRIDPVERAAENFCPAKNQFLGVFAGRDFERATRSGEVSSALDYTLVEISRDLVWRNVSASDFADAKSTIRREQDRLFSSAHPELKQLINCLNRDVQNAAAADVSLSLGHPLSLGVS